MVCMQPRRCSRDAAKELQVLASDPFNSRAAQVGLPVLRLLRTLTTTCKATADQVHCPFGLNSVWQKPGLQNDSRADCEHTPGSVP